MGNKPRQIIQFTQPQMDWLKERARELDISVSELVRRIIDQYREDEA